MEMNFPHKRLSKSEGDFRALIACAIARQALTPSARAFAARRSSIGAVKSHRLDGGVEDRIKFFAGVSSNDIAVQKNDTIFPKGYFRPDLVSKDISSGGADRNYERAVYLDDLVV